jgi:hypothetical protein
MGRKGNKGELWNITLYSEGTTVATKNKFHPSLAYFEIISQYCNMKGCLNCGKLFDPKRERAVFCSDLCRASFHQRKRVAEKKVARAQELKFHVAHLEKNEKAAKLWDELLKELGPVKFLPATEKSYDGKKINMVTQDETSQTLTPPEKPKNSPITLLKKEDYDVTNPNRDEIKKLLNELMHPPKSLTGIDLTIWKRELKDRIEKLRNQTP